MIRVKKLSKDEQLRIIEEKREKGRWIYEGQLAYDQEQGLNEGINKGIEEGVKKGIAKGRLTEKEEVARKMLKANSDIIFIQTVTGLSKKRIVKLQNEIQR